MIPVYLSYFDTNTDFWSPSASAKNKYILLFTLMLPYSLGPKLNGTVTVVSTRSGKKLKKHNSLLYSCQQLAFGICILFSM